LLTAASLAISSMLLLPTSVPAQQPKAQSSEVGKNSSATRTEPSISDPAKTNRPQISKEEVETILPLLLRSVESRELAGELEVRLRKGDITGAKQLVDGFVEASTFAVLVSDWLHEPKLLSMLQTNGVRGTDHPSPPLAAAEVNELKAALQAERERAQGLAREHAAATEKVASLQSSQERSAVAAAEVNELKAALQAERERAQGLAREHAAATEKVAALTRAKVSADQPPLPDSSSLTGSLSARSLSASVLNSSPVTVESPLISRAGALLRSGDVSGARLLLERASEAGDIPAILLLAESFDPQFLATLRVRGIRGDLSRAEELRARAQSLQQGPGSKMALPR
jgi:hypothetical protein